MTVGGAATAETEGVVEGEGEVREIDGGGREAVGMAADTELGAIGVDGAGSVVMARTASKLVLGVALGSGGEATESVGCAAIVGVPLRISLGDEGRSLEVETRGESGATDELRRGSSVGGIGRAASGRRLLVMRSSRSCAVDTNVSDAARGPCGVSTARH